MEVGMSRIGTGLVACAAVVGIVIGLTPQPAHAALTITARASASIEIAFGACAEQVFVYTEADFSQAVSFTEVTVSWTGPGAPLGKAGHHSPGSTSDDFVFTWPVAGLVPGARIEATVHWSAHAGGLNSAGETTQSVGVRLHDNPWNHKVNLQGKCVIESQAKDYAKQAAQARAAANDVRASCPTCASVYDSVAAANESIADRLHKIALDPPDPNFTVLPTAAAISPPPIAVGTGVSAAAVNALNDLLRLLADSSAQAHAAVTAIERSQGARLAADQEWEKNQALAAADFIKTLATKQSGVPAAAQAAAAALQAGGFPDPNITAVKRATAVGKYITSGPSNADWLRQQAGHTDEDLQEIAALLGSSSSQITGAMPALAGLTDPSFATTITSTVATLNKAANEFIANPFVDYAGETSTSQPSSSPTPSVPTPTRSAGAAEGTSLLGNSGFESPALRPGAAYDTLTTQHGGAGLAPWKLQQGSVDVVATPGAQAATGGQFIDLNGNDTAAGPGTITQDAAVTPGHRYRLSFQLAGNPNGDPPIKTVEVDLAGQKDTFSFDTKGHTNSDLGWATHTMEHSACGESSLTVTFRSTTKGIRGPNLDNIVLVDIGPSSCSGFPLWLIILGVAIVLIALAAVVALYLRRRRNSKTASVADAPDPGSVS
jgi:choice-of-anchor C domain-containing protein